MNSEKASKKLVQSLTDLVNMAKWLMDENEQPSVTQELGRLFPSVRGRGRRGESSELHGVSADDSVLQHDLSENGRLKKYGDQKQHQRNH